MNLFFDTSVLVASAVRHHPHHPPAFAALTEVTSGRHRGFAAAHSLAETYAEIVVPGTTVDERELNTVRLRFNRREITAEALIRRVTERYHITDVSIIEPDIESIVRRIYREGYHDGTLGAPS